jgi:hypothetical protein
MFPAVKDIGGYRAPDGYNEHSSGEVFSEISVEYMSLYDMSRRSRYDVGRLSEGLGDDAAVLNLMIGQWRNVRNFCLRRKASRAF